LQRASERRLASSTAQRQIAAAPPFADCATSTPTKTASLAATRHRLRFGSRRVEAPRIAETIGIA